MTRALPDYLASGLRVVFVGFNPGETSAREGHYYAYPGNRFYWLLWQAGLTDRLYAPHEDAALLDLGYGLTDLVGRSTRSSGDLTAAELRAGREELLAKLARYRPRVACYNGKGIYAALSGRARVAYGLQAGSVVPGVLDFVAASPSGRSREKLEEKLRLYRELRDLIAEGDEHGRLG
ncbi:mismatch-specific DNA-glycosylase [Symbiobacterium terraclitae]|uniref:mismatch-specific DNA-glycosylase n=1 Tax=Symbiobacterium terraclitae TaxID=557451 RepID=UPI0035B5178D